MPFRDGIALDEVEAAVGAVEWIVPSVVLAELTTLSEGISATARAATGALRLAAAMESVTTELPGDDGVLDVARREGEAVLSNDKRLLSEAKRSGLVALAPRGRRVQRF